MCTPRRRLERGEIDTRIRCAQRWQRPHRCRTLSDVTRREVPMPIVQPNTNSVSGQRTPDDDVKIVVMVDVAEADRDGVIRGFERDVVRGLP